MIYKEVIFAKRKLKRKWDAEGIMNIEGETVSGGRKDGVWLQHESQEISG